MNMDDFYPGNNKNNLLTENNQKNNLDFYPNFNNNN